MSTKRLFQHEKAWIESEFLKIEARIKELGLELGEAMDQSSETWHDNGPADVIMNEVGTLWSKHAWLLSEKSKMLMEYPGAGQTAEIGNIVTLESDGKTLRIVLGNINIEDPGGLLSVGSESPLSIFVIGKSIGASVSVGSTTYTLQVVDVYS